MEGYRTKNFRKSNELGVITLKAYYTLHMNQTVLFKLLLYTHSYVVWLLSYFNIKTIIQVKCIQTSIFAKSNLGRQNDIGYEMKMFQSFYSLISLHIFFFQHKLFFVAHIKMAFTSIYLCLYLYIYVTLQLKASLWKQWNALTKGYHKKCIASFSNLSLLYDGSKSFHLFL